MTPKQKALAQSPEHLRPLVEALVQHEGYLPNIYLDTTGHYTIGFGSNIHEKVNIPEIHGVDNHVRMLIRDAEKAYSYASHLVSNFRELSRARQYVLAEMVYQMGLAGVQKFKKMLAAIEAEDFETASKEGLDSLWATQTPNRARVLMKKMKNNA